MQSRERLRIDGHPIAGNVRIEEAKLGPPKCGTGQTGAVGVK
jgi:hypothetical protein